MLRLDFWYFACLGFMDALSVSSCRENALSLIKRWQGHARNPTESPDHHTVGQRACYSLWVTNSEPEGVQSMCQIDWQGVG